LQISSQSIKDGTGIEDAIALAVPAVEGHVTLAANVSPNLSWAGAPGETKSFVFTCIDADCPSAPTDVNQDAREVPPDDPGVDFTLWPLIDVPWDTMETQDGAHSSGVEPGGNDADTALIGVHGQNDYTSWFDGDPDMGGSWNGDDGSASQWNESVPHRYEFMVAAIDTPAVGLAPGFGLASLLETLDGHVLVPASPTLPDVLNASLR
jgi:phosphatidylethanolamine-binding protein (PEBP) family uncharacterized protein